MPFLPVIRCFLKSTDFEEIFCSERVV
ncbi:MAG: hypothetical protein RIR70_735, partial [Pseudomonadota bacterium]